MTYSYIHLTQGGIGQLIYLEDHFWKVAFSGRLYIAMALTSYLQHKVGGTSRFEDIC